MKRLWQFIIFTFLSAIIISCNTKPREVLNDRKMVAVFQDMYIANGLFIEDKDAYKADSIKDAVINGVLKKHGITQIQFDSSLMWYADNIEAFTAIQDTVSARLQKRVDMINLLSASNAYDFKLTNFEIELPNYYVLDNDNPTFVFRLDSVKLQTIELDKFNFHFTLQGVDTSAHKIDATVYFKYTSDTTLVVRKELLNDGHYEFNIPYPFDDHSVLKEVFSYIHLKVKNEKYNKIYLNNIHNLSIDKDLIPLVGDSTEVKLTEIPEN